MSSERQLDNTNNPWWGEHIHRYEEAAKIIGKDQKTILDIACGTGFGSHYLATLGHKVVGADISEIAIDECSKKYVATTLVFKIVDGTNIPYEDEYFDSIVSFETIEHTRDFKKMLNEFKRVVKQNGVVIISTPNFLVNSPDGYVVNPYHTQEWEFDELKKILSDVFQDVQLFGQKYSRYDLKGIRNKAGNIMERIMYKRGIRKLPIKFQDMIMHLAIKKPMYPTKRDYDLVTDLSLIVKCKTFFAVCRK